MRDHRIDNAKGMLIFLVVLGHFIEGIGGWELSLLRLPHTTMYAFHMPAFVFFAGMTADRKMPLRRIGVIAVMLVAFNLAYVLPYLRSGSWPDAPLQPHWILWFLMSLIWWQAMLPFLVKLRHALLLSVVLALLVGAIPINGHILSIFRTIVFLPFFLLGHLHGSTFLDMAGRWKNKGLVLMVSVLTVAVLYQLNLNSFWYYGSYGYDYFKSGWIDGILTRSLLMAAAFPLLFSFASFLPAKSFVLNAAGRNSLAIYLLHGFVVRYSGKFVDAVSEKYGDILVLLYAMVASSLIVYVFSGPWWSRTIKSGAQAVVSAAEVVCANASRKLLLRFKTKD